MEENVKRYVVGDHIIYRKQKASPHPSRRARNIRPSDYGETYSYLVEKYWVVSAVLDDGCIEVMTRTGKLHYLRADDPNLRQPSLIERWFYRDRFPQLSSAKA